MPEPLSSERPWGSWHVLYEGDGFKVKRIVVLPQQRLSYQTHARRAEHWNVVRGVATCTVDGETRELPVGSALDVPIGAAHRLANLHDEVLEVIEVQRGDYLGEDDIVRLDDDYGRDGASAVT
jgi:mannose-6-phosphate isomerase-like protein (cupin superfamily)